MLVTSRSSWSPPNVGQTSLEREETCCQWWHFTSEGAIVKEALHFSSFLNPLSSPRCPESDISDIPHQCQRSLACPQPSLASPRRETCCQWWQLHATCWSSNHAVSFHLSWWHQWDTLGEPYDFGNILLAFDLQTCQFYRVQPNTCDILSGVCNKDSLWLLCKEEELPLNNFQQPLMLLIYADMND